MYKLCSFCKLRNHFAVVECRHCGARLGTARPDSMPFVEAQPLPAPLSYAVHTAGGWCDQCGLVLHAYSRRCPGCRSSVGHPARVRTLPFDAAMRFVLARKLQIAAGFMAGLLVGVVCGIGGLWLNRYFPGDRLIPAMLSGWMLGLIAYRSTRRFDIACSRGVGIGTLLGQLLSVVILLDANYDLIP